MNSIQLPDITKASVAGIEFLRGKLYAGKYGLSCFGLDGSPKFSNQKGHLFSIYHIAQAFGEKMNEIDRTILLTRILSEEYDAQWGYSPRGYYKQEGSNPFFVDADDTAFALRTLRIMDVYRSPEIFRKYLSIWDNNGVSENAFLTFLTDQKNRMIFSEKNFENNFQLHPEVNANVYHALLDSALDEFINEDFIRATQAKDGYWLSFFYPNSFFGTLQFMSLLRKTGKMQDEFEKGRLFLINSQNNDGGWGKERSDVFLAALALKSLCLQKGDFSAKQKALEYLLQTQSNDGFWETSEIIWEFHDADKDVWRAFDSENVITTACCVDALNLLSREIK